MTLLLMGIGSIVTGLGYIIEALTKKWKEKCMIILDILLTIILMLFVGILGIKNIINDLLLFLTAI